MLDEEGHKKLDVEQRDHYHVVRPFNLELYREPKKLKIGFLRSIDKFIPADQSNQRSVQLTVEELRKAGHEVVELDEEFQDQLVQAI